MDRDYVVVMLDPNDGETVLRTYNAAGMVRADADRLANEKNRRYSRSRGLVFETRRKDEAGEGE